jgi:hypothetical protein
MGDDGPGWVLDGDALLRRVIDQSARLLALEPLSGSISTGLSGDGKGK